MRKWATATLAVFAWVAVGIYLHRHMGSLRELSFSHKEFLVFSGLASILALVLNGLILQQLLKRIGLSLTALDGARLSTLTTTINSLVPSQGGAGIRAVYLNRMFGLSFGNFAALSLVAEVPRLLFNSLLFFCVYVVSRGIPFSKLSLPLGLLTLMVLALWNWRARSSLLLRWLPRSFQEGCRSLLRDGRSLVLLSLCIAMSASLEGLAFYSIYRSFGLEPNVIFVLGMAAGGNLASAINLTPGGIGIYEAVVAYFSQAIGIAAPTVVAASLVYRVSLVCVMGALLPFCMTILTRKHPAPILDSRDEPPRKLASG